MKLELTHELWYNTNWNSKLK